MSSSWFEPYFLRAKAAMTDVRIAPMEAQTRCSPKLYLCSPNTLKVIAYKRGQMAKYMLLAMKWMKKQAQNVLPYGGGGTTVSPDLVPLQSSRQAADCSTSPWHCGASSWAAVGGLPKQVTFAVFTTQNSERLWSHKSAKLAGNSTVRVGTGGTKSRAKFKLALTTASSSTVSLCFWILSVTTPATIRTTPFVMGRYPRIIEHSVGVNPNCL